MSGIHMWYIKFEFEQYIQAVYERYTHAIAQSSEESQMDFLTLF